MDTYALYGVAAAFIGVAAAAVFDLGEKKIPNWIPLGMLLFSAPLAVLGGYPLPWLLNFFLAAAVFYLFWALRVWAAGDSKLMIAAAALIPQYPQTALLPAPAYGGFFFLSVVANLLLVYLLYAVSLIIRNSARRNRFIYIVGAVIAVAACAYALDFRFVVPFLFFFLVFRIYYEAGKLDLTKTVAAADLQVGDNLAERFVEEDGKVIREREKSASVSSFLSRLASVDEAAPAAYGLSREEKERLVGFVASGRIEDGIRIYRGVVMSPMILAAVILSVSAGDLLSLAV